MNVNEINAMKQERKRAHSYATSLLQKSSMTAEDRSSFDKAMSHVDELGEKIRRAENGTSAYTGSYRTNPWENASEHRKAEAFGKFLRNGDNGLTAEQRTLLSKRDVTEGDLQSQVGTYTSLGYFVPAGFKYDVEQAEKYFAPLLSDGVCQVIETATGQPLPFPTSNDTSNKATIVAENAAVSEKDVAAGHISFTAYKLSSGLVKASVELMQDSAFNLEAYLAARFGERYGRGLEDILTNGTGSSEPTGILVAIAASGATPVTAVGSAANDGSSATGANSIGYTDLVDLEHSVDPAYRRNAKYMFHDNTLAALKKLLDKYGRPLWTPGITAGDPDRINGYAYVINQSVPTIAASATTMVFGDFSKFIIRRVKALSVQRLNELYAANGQVGFLSFARIDSNIIDAGTHPLNTLTQAS